MSTLSRCTVFESIDGHGSILEVTCWRLGSLTVAVSRVGMSVTRGSNGEFIVCAGDDIPQYVLDIHPLVALAAVQRTLMVHGAKMLSPKDEDEILKAAATAKAARFNPHVDAKKAAREVRKTLPGRAKRAA
jgi:hypothetical protein